MPGYGREYWAERTARHRRHSYPAFRGKHAADVVVIGGGLTGSTAAYVFANAGLSVILLEAGRLASGSTAGSLGAILPQPDAVFRTVERAAGLRVARGAWKAARRSALEFASALRRLRIKCDLMPAPLVVNARTSEAAQALRREQAARKAAGIDVPWLPGPAAAAEIGADSAGAIRLRDGCVYDPVRAALGLAAAAELAGARIFEQSSVRRTRFTRKHADVLVATGAVRTRNVYVATGGPGELFGQLRRHVSERAGYVVVTEPLSAAMKRETGRRAAVATETGEAPHWLRWLADDRAMFAGALSKPVGSRQLDKAVAVRAAQLMYELSLWYPAISGLPASSAWSVPVVSTADGLPWIGRHRNYPFHFFAMALGWHGDSLAFLAAKSALRAFRDETTRDDEAFGFLRSH
jgi:gamma-glutamylputrescine oxidase